MKNLEKYLTLLQDHQGLLLTSRFSRHYGAEFAGMRLLAEDLNETVAPTVFLDGGEVYRFL